VEYSPIASPLRYDRARVRPVVGLRAGCEANAWCAAGAGDVIARSGRTELSEVGVASGHCPTLQWGSLIARPQVSAITRTVIAAARRRLASLPGLVMQQTFDPGLNKALLRSADADALRHLLDPPKRARIVTFRITYRL